LQKKNKLETKKKAPGTTQDATAPGAKVTRGKNQASSSGSNKEKGPGGVDGVAPQAKKGSPNRVPNVRQPRCFCGKEGSSFCCLEGLDDL
jgi:hypothetical protein